jgi:acyl-CoA thioester hydrolase
LKDAAHAPHHHAARAHAKEFSLPVRVYYQDTDAGGVVYHSRYLDFMERARYEWLRGFGYDANRFTDELKIVFVIRSAALEFLKPARLDDLLQVTARVVDSGRSRVSIAQRILRDHATLVEGTVNAVCVSLETWKPVSIPPEIRHAFGE